MNKHTARFLSLFCVAVLALTAVRAEEVEIGFPKDFRRWKPVVSDNPKTPDNLRAMGRFALVEHNRWKCAFLECAAPAMAGNVCITRKIALTPQQEQLTLKGVRVELQTSDIRMLVVRFLDDTGQTFQNRYEIPVSAGVQTVFCSLPAQRPQDFPPNNSWGGANDKVVHHPIREIGLLIDGSMRPELRLQTVFKTIPVTLALHLGRVTLVYE